MKEIWKQIPGYENYEVSNLGQVKSLNYMNTNKHHLLKPIESGIYLFVKLSKNGVVKTKHIHQLVAIAFLNHTPNGNKMVVNHIDHNKRNNHLNNLEVITNRQNTSLSHIPSSSKYTGVSWNKRSGKWQAYIKVKSKQIHLGFHLKEAEAAKAYQKAIKNINVYL